MVDFLFYQKNIWQEEILPRLDLKSILNLLSVCHFFYDNLCIIDLYQIDEKLRKKLNDTILKQNKFINAKYLDASNNSEITDVNHLKKLQKLDVRWNCGIDQKGIQLLENLIELDAWDNPKITNVNHLKKLQKLGAGMNCGIDQKGIKLLENLIELDAWNNFKITGK